MGIGVGFGLFLCGKMVVLDLFGVGQVVLDLVWDNLGWVSRWFGMNQCGINRSTFFQLSTRVSEVLSEGVSYPKFRAVPLAFSQRCN